MRICFRCKLGKPLDEFYPKRRPKPPHGWNHICKDCSKLGACEWAKKNKDKHCANTKKWWLENKSKHAKSVAKWAANNMEMSSARTKKWKKANPHKLANYSAKRRANKIMPEWANKFFIEEIYDLAQRRTKVLGYPWHVDHIVPIISPLVCGLHVENNLQVIPWRENLSKGNKTWPDMPC